MLFEIEKDFQFEAAHYFVHDDANDLFKRVHGHSFRGTVTVRGNAQDEKGWVRDLWKIEQIVKDVVSPLDHALLNDVEGLEQPALEQIAAWIFERLGPKLPGLHCVEVGRPSCGERARIVAP
ncbi:6-pyruvoyl tetrahydropterin synthase family protein [Algimonas porphyrae]|uniref:6-carboxy-5,6,7,8-tetrahydropterin synthase n=1 Tax=Algimonas porphyrae TaxID=1128113 RepID=A0ABQ5UXW6_9PROT|nr:6-carboxytetrahydropterin synthase [Algimonas porphyrae]GLQ20145.1 6-carboxy-5,6,7,8-tetrahydropterin synthase [Algimonas porphyrae]